MENETVVAEKPEAAAPVEPEVQAPASVSEAIEAEPQEEPLTEASEETPAEAEGEEQPETPERQPWNEVREQYKDDEEFKRDKERDLKRARRQGIASVATDVQQAQQTSSQAMQTLRAVQKAFNDMPVAQGVTPEQLAETMQSVPSLANIATFTTELQSRLTYDSIAYGIATAISALGEVRGMDKEAADEMAKGLLLSARTQLFPLLTKGDDGTLSWAQVKDELADEVSDLLSELPSPQKLEKLEKENAEMRAQIAKYKAGRTEGPDTSGKAAIKGDRSVSSVLGAANKGDISRDAVMERARTDPDLAKWIS
ncbi:MAG: hypothetical protein ACE5FA_09390 [Dehalococcoidia bacterium]